MNPKKNTDTEESLDQLSDLTKEEWIEEFDTMLSELKWTRSDYCKFAGISPMSLKTTLCMASRQGRQVPRYVKMSVAVHKANNP